MFNKYICSSIICFLPIVAQANLFIDYQGVTPKEKTVKELREAQGVPDGYSFYTNKYKGVIHEVGSGKPEKITQFGTDSDMKLALSMIVPDGWVVYAEEQFTKIPKVSWDSENEPWLTTLSKIGSNYGVRFIVDWDQQVVQISQDLEFVAPDFNQPVILDVPESDKKLFVYTNDSTSESKGGFILVDGKLVPIKVKDLD